MINKILILRLKTTLAKKIRTYTYFEMLYTYKYVYLNETLTNQKNKY